MSSIAASVADTDVGVGEGLAAGVVDAEAEGAGEAVAVGSTTEVGRPATDADGVICGADEQAATRSAAAAAPNQARIRKVSLATLLNPRSDHAPLPVVAEEERGGEVAFRLPDVDCPSGLIDDLGLWDRDPSDRRGLVRSSQGCRVSRDSRNCPVADVKPAR